MRVAIDRALATVPGPSTFAEVFARDPAREATVAIGDASTSAEEQQGLAHAPTESPSPSAKSTSIHELEAKRETTAPTAKPPARRERLARQSRTLKLALAAIIVVVVFAVAALCWMLIRP
jgi:hypothetical protein